MFVLPWKSRAPHKAPTTPPARLNVAKKGLKNELTIPPSNVETVPKYGPRTMPIIGANIVATVMYFEKPIN